jgi:hypothetical protein
MSVGRFIADTKRFFRGRFHFLKGMVIALGDLEKYARKQVAFIEKMSADIRDSERETLFLTIGRALSLWATMEEFLVIIVAHLLVVRTAQAGLIMYSILNFNVWLSLIHDLMALDGKFEPLQKKWNKISERIRRIKDLRDQLAHYSVSTSEAHLKPSKFDIRQKTRLQRPLDLREVFELMRTIIAICADLEILINDLDLILSSSKKSAEPSPDHSPESDSR